MLFSESINRPVMSTDTARTVGLVSGFVVDPSSAKVVAVRLRKAQGTGDTLHWEDLKAFGADAVTTASADNIVAGRGKAADLGGKRSDLVGKRLLTDAGEDIGVITDVDFDPANGAVVSLLTTAGPIQGRRLIGCGSYAVVVTHS